MTVSPEMFATVHAEAVKTAVAFADEEFAAMGGDRGACGFGWVEVFGVRSNSKLGKAMLAAGFRKSYTGGLTLWNPAKAPVQSVDILEAGALGYASVLKKYGFEQAYAQSRLD